MSYITYLNSLDEAYRYTQDLHPQYKKEETWTKIILHDKRCIYCDAKLIKTSNIRKCSKCNHIIYGNPQLINYTHQKCRKPGNIQLIQREKCPECQNTKLTYNEHQDETICRKCGLVLDGPPGTEYPFSYKFIHKTGK